MRKRILTLVGLIALCGQAFAEELAVAVPFRSQSDQAQLSEGGQWSILSEVLSAAGMQPVFTPLPIARIFAGLQDGSVPVWFGPKVPEVESFVIDAGTLDYVRVAAFSLRGPQVHGISDLEDHSVVDVQNYTYWSIDNSLASNPKIELSRAHSHEDALSMLLGGRVEYLVDYDAAVKRVSDPGKRAELVRSILATWPRDFLVSRRAPHADDIAARLRVAVTNYVRAHPISE